MMARQVAPLDAGDPVTPGQLSTPLFLRWANAVMIAVNALLTGSSTKSGFLFPRLTTTQRNAIAAPTAGETIFNTTTSKAQTWDGAAWQNLH